MQGFLEAGMKTCSRCGDDKPASEFHKDSRSKDGLRSVCKQCWSQRQKAYRSARKEEISESSKRYYRQNKEKINRRTKIWRKENHEMLMERQSKRRDRAKVLMAEVKTPCVKCGEDRPWVVQFHHIDPSEKVFEITAEAISYKKWEVILQEASKCACLCANCHTEFHHFYGKNPSDPVSAFAEYIGGEDDDAFTRPPGDRVVFKDRLPFLDAGRG